MLPSSVPEGRVRKDVADGELSSVRLDRVLGVHDAIVRNHSRGHLSKGNGKRQQGRKNESEGWRPSGKTARV